MIDFPNSPTVGQVFGNYRWDGITWTAGATISASAVRYDAAQALTAAQQKQGRANIGVNDGNIVINGDFRINQTGYVSAAALAAGTYGHDQWKAGAAGGDYSFTQLKSSTQITIASGKSLVQPIEDVNVAGGSYVLTWTGTAQARAGVNTLTPSGAYAASPLLISGQTAGTVMSIEFNAGTLGTVKLETGSTATPFVMRPFDLELLSCQRYWQKSYNYDVAPGTVTNAGVHAAMARTAYSLACPVVRWWTTMRGVPSVNGISPQNGASGFMADYNGADTFASNRAAVIFDIGTSSAFVAGTAGDLTIDTNKRIHWIANARL